MRTAGSRISSGTAVAADKNAAPDLDVIFYLSDLAQFALQLPPIYVAALNFLQVPQMHLAFFAWQRARSARLLSRFLQLKAHRLHYQLVRCLLSLAAER